MSYCSLAIGYGNLTDSATITVAGSPSWSSSFPPSNLQLRELARVARSVGTATSDTILYLDHGTAKAARVICLIAHNLRSTATVRVKRGTSSGGAQHIDSGALSAWPFTPTDGGYDGSHFAVIIVLDESTTSRYTTIELSDSGNPDGYLEIGRLFVGPAFVPTDGPQVGDLSDGWMPPNSLLDRTENGADWVHELDEMRAVALAFDNLTEAEGSLFHDIVRTHKIVNEVVYIPSVSDRAATQQYGFLGVMDKLSALDYPKFATKRGTAIGIAERGGAA